jgi:hypothetical protein
VLLLLLCATDKPHPSLVDLIVMACIATIHYDQHSLVDAPQCNTAEELVHLAYDHLDTISPRGITAFWAALPKLLHRWDGKSQLDEQLAENIMQYTRKYEGV